MNDHKEENSLEDIKPIGRAIMFKVFLNQAQGPESWLFSESFDLQSKSLQLIKTLQSQLYTIEKKEDFFYLLEKVDELKTNLILLRKTI